MEDTTDADYMHAKKVRKDFEIENLGEYQNLYLKSDTLPLGSCFQKRQKNIFKYLSFRSCKFISAPGLAQQAALKKEK